MDNLDFYEHVKHESETQWYDIKILDILDCAPEDIIVLGERLRIGHPNREPIAEAAIKYIFDRFQAEGWEKKILFYLGSEGFATTHLDFTQMVVEKLLTNPNVKYKNLYVVTGAQDVEYNHNLYYRYCLMMKYLPLQVIYTNPFEGGSARDARENGEIEHSLEPQRDKKFLFYNRQPRAHRIAAISEIMKRGLRDKAYMSYNMDRKSGTATDGVRLLIPKAYDVSKQYIELLGPELPLNLTLTDDYNVFNLADKEQQDVLLFKQSLFSLISETLFSHSVDYYNPHVRDNIHCFSCSFHTEKTWKVLRASHPFVMLSTPYSLRSLREVGYKTFHPYINESYDTIEDDYERLQAVIDEVERLCNMTDDETREWLRNVQPITKHNFETIKSKDYYAYLR